MNLCKHISHSHHNRGYSLGWNTLGIQMCNPLMCILYAHTYKILKHTGRPIKYYRFDDECKIAIGQKLKPDNCEMVNIERAPQRQMPMENRECNHTIKQRMGKPNYGHCDQERADTQTTLYTFIKLNQIFMTLNCIYYSSKLQRQQQHQQSPVCVFNIERV